MSAQIIVIRWRDIPAQVTAKLGRTTRKIEMSKRFHLAIDRAAMDFGLIGSDEYLEQWRREVRECGDDLEAEAALAALELEQSYPQDVLNQLIARGGFEARGVE